MDLPFRILRPFTGPRVVKTGLAVFLALLISHALGSQYGAFAAVAAMLAVQPSVSRARQVFFHQVLSNLMGGLIGAGLGLYFGPGSAAMALGVILVLGLCVRLGLNETAQMAVTAVIFIMDRPEQDFIRYTAWRLGAVMGGMLIGALVNRYIRPPNYYELVAQHLRTAAERVHCFGEHLIGSLISPAHYSKDQIKGEAREIARSLETVSYFLDLSHEAEGNSPRLLPLDKAKASLYVFLERITDIHKVVLQTGGLNPGLELGTVAAALRAVLAFKSEVVAAALESRRPASGPAEGFVQALAALESLAQELIDDRETRERGLALHTLVTNIRHMGWRMESLTRLLADR